MTLKTLMSSLLTEEASPYKKVMASAVAVSTMATALKNKALRAAGKLTTQERNDLEQHLDEIDKEVMRLRALIKRW